MAALTREQILNRKIGRDTVPLADGSGEVVIRALTRNEALQVRDQESTADRDNLVLHLGLVEPALTLEDVAAWADSDSAGVLADLSERIGRLSGMMADSGKEAYKSTGRGRRTRV
jgi:hypothetical protein